MADNDGTGLSLLVTVNLDTKHLRLGVTAVLSTTGTLLVRGLDGEQADDIVARGDGGGDFEFGVAGQEGGGGAGGDGEALEHTREGGCGGRHRHRVCLQFTHTRIEVGAPSTLGVVVDVDVVADKEGLMAEDEGDKKTPSPVPKTPPKVPGLPWTSLSRLA